MTRNEAHPEGKVLFIGGGIANFTNVAATFKGIIRALREYAHRLVKHRVQVYVRRGGPNYQEGLKLMRELGDALELPIHVFGPEAHITAIVPLALKGDTKTLEASLVMGGVGGVGGGGSVGGGSEYSDPLGRYSRESSYTDLTKLK